MKRELNKRALFSILIFLLLFTSYGVYLFQTRDVNENDNQLSKKITSNKFYNNLEFKDAEINKTNNITRFAMNIHNNSNTIYEAETIKLVFLSKQGKVVCTLYSVIPEIASYSDARIDTIMENECMDAYTFVIEKNEE